MAIYDPTDPYNWKGIAASQQGLNPDGSTKYVLPDMGMDPEFIAYLTQYDYGTKTAQTDAELRRQQQRLAYEQALADLEQQGQQSARSTDTNLLARGVFGSGERQVRQGELSQALGQGRARADQTYAQSMGQIDADLQSALTGLGLERERQIVASQARIAETQRQGAIDAGVLGGNSGGSTQRPRAQTSSTSQAPTLSQPAATRPINPNQAYRPPTTSAPTPGGTQTRRPSQPLVVRY